MEENVFKDTAQTRKGRGVGLNSGGLDSQLAMCVLLEQGVELESITFTSPFYPRNNAGKAAAALGVKHTFVDFTDDIIALVKNPPHGLGSCMNPCIDCHAMMIRRAAEFMEKHGFDFVFTGEVLGQRPMSQQRQGLNIVQKDSGLGDKLLRPLSALLLPETEPEKLGLVDRSRLLALEGRNRKPQLALAKKYGLRDFPTPAGGCKLTEPNYSRRLKNLMDHEGLDDTRLVNLLNYGRHLRLPGGTLAVVGRNKADNEAIRQAMRGGDVLLKSVNVPGPTILAVRPANEDVEALRRLCSAYADNKGIGSITISEMRAASKPVEFTLPVCDRAEFTGMVI